MHSDPIADMLTRIRNSVRNRSDKVDIPASKIKLEIAEILKEDCFIRAYKILKFKKQGMLRLNLKYVNDKSLITDLKRVSKPSCRHYVGSADVPSVRSGVGIAILTTSNGLKTDQTCRRDGVGGEVLCYVW